MSVKKRNFWMLLLLSVVTCGIYNIIWWFMFTEDMNRITEGKSAEKPSPNYILVLLLSFVTCGIYGFIWTYRQGNRLADAAQYYGIRNQTTGSSLIVWSLFGSLLCGLGPFIALIIWIDLFNKVADAYNGTSPDGGGTFVGGTSGTYNGISQGSAYLTGNTPVSGSDMNGSEKSPFGAEENSGFASAARKMEQGVDDLAEKIQNSKGLSDIKKMVGDKMPAFQKNSEICRQLMTSKYKTAVGGNVRSFNTAELIHPEAPLLITRLLIADIGQDGRVGLHIGFQNLAERKVIGIYLDIICYNMLKEQIGVLTDLSYIDLSVEKGQIFETPVPVALPDKAVRRCDIIVRHVVYDDDIIWSYEGDEAFFQIEEQAVLNLPDGLNDEFKRQMRQMVPDVFYTFAPDDRGDYWLCACGQFNRAEESRCIACGADKDREFGFMDIEWLRNERNIYLEKEKAAKEEAERLEAERIAREEALKAQRIAERNQKIEEAQKKAKEAFDTVKNKGAEYYAKGEEKIKEAVISYSSTVKQTGQQEIVCPKCGRSCRAGDKFCMGCGTKLSPIQASPEKKPVEEPLQNEEQDELKTVVLNPETTEQMGNAREMQEEKPAEEEAAEESRNEKIICPTCGTENVPGSKFCMSCGSRIDE